MILFKIKAGALQLTMFIVVVIALLLAAFIILIHTHKRFSIQTDFVIETINNANKGVNYVLENKTPLNDSVNINLQDENFKTVTVHRDFWGFFEKVISISKIKTNTIKKVGLIGAVQPKTNRTALYIEDQNKPFVVVGNTKIQGVAYLPKQGVRTGNISGHSYYGNQLIYGPTKTSVHFPELTKETINHIETIQKGINHFESNQFLDLKNNMMHQNSFFNPLQVVYSNTDISLSQVTLTGHILVQSKTKISVDASCVLKDVILIAPIIEIKNNTKGVFQAIATKQITVGKSCSLEYPSALVLNEDLKIKGVINNTNSNNETIFIKIQKGTNIKGVVVYLGDTKNYKAQVFIDEKSAVTGEVYCNKNFELLGAVYGAVFTSNFVASQSGSSYQNHLYNGTILIDELPQEYVGLNFNNSKKGVMKWLY